MMKIILNLCLIFSLSLSTTEVWAQVIYVKHDATGAEDGSNWANAYVDLQDAINAAGPTNQIWVARGTYKPTQAPPFTTGSPTVRDRTFLLDKTVRLYGGFEGDEDPEVFNLNDRPVLSNQTMQHETILSGDLDGDGTLSAGDAYHVLVAQGGATGIVIDGFTVTGGNSVGASGNAAVQGGALPRANGAGLVVRSSEITLDHVWFKDNHALTSGGAMQVIVQVSATVSSPNDVTINNCLFEGNQAAAAGGINVTRTGTNTSGNTLTIDGSAFIGNTSTGIGGGIQISPVGTIDITNTLFENNSATHGGGIAVAGANNNDLGVVNIDGATFVRNTATGAAHGGAIRGAGFSRVDIKNTLFEENSAAQGGALHQSAATSEFSIAQSRFVNNKATTRGGAAFLAQGTVDISNVLFYENAVTISTSGAGGALNLFNGIAPTITGSTFYSNSTVGSAGGGAITVDGGTAIDAKVYNSIFFENRATHADASDKQDIIIASGPHSIEVKHAITQQYSTDDNIANNIQVGVPPAFLALPTTSANYDPDHPDFFRLSDGSPAVNAGDNSYAVTHAEDLAGNNRIQRGIIDLGTYESTYGKTVTLSVEWNGEALPADGSLELFYGEEGTLTVVHDNTDNPTVEFPQEPATNSLLSISGPANGNQYTVTGLRVNGSSEEGKLIVRLPNTTAFDGTELEFDVVVTPRPVTVIPDNVTKQSGATEPALTFTLDPGSLGMVGSDIGALSRELGEDIGTYDFLFTVANGSDDVTANYNITIDPAQFQITNVQLTIVPDAASKVYGSIDPPFTYAQPVDLPSGYKVEGILSREPGDNVGNYAFTGNFVVLDDNNIDVTSNYFIIIDQNVKFEILPSPITVAADEKTKVFGESDPTLTFTISGLVNGDTPSDVDFTGEIQRAPGENVGTYPIRVHTLALNSPNYVWDPTSFVESVFTITKAPQQITLTAAAEEVQLNAGRLILTVVSSSGLPVVLSVDDATIATISGTDLNLLSGGTVTVTATQEGNDNYEAASPVSLTIRVIAPEYNDLVRVHPSVSPNGDGINDFLRIEGVEKYPDNRITIFDRAGNVIKEISGYDNNQNVFTAEYVRDGTYFYRLGITVSGERQYHQGFFEVKRN